MSATDKSSTSASGDAAGASSTAGNAAKKAAAEQNPAFRMMGLPRLRLPSRNWMIFWTVTGSFAGAVIYDKWQTKRMREKWCNLVSHIADEPLDSKTQPRRVTIYLEAPPGDGLRAAREHFHTYVKPVLVSAAMDWDVVEGRKEGDVRHKTAERIRKRRKKNGEGEPLPPEDETTLTVEKLREQNGDIEYPGVAGDIVIGRHTWKEYIRGLHEGYLGPPDPPKEALVDTIFGEASTGHKPDAGSDPSSSVNPSESSSVGDAAVKGATQIAAQSAGNEPLSSLDSVVGSDGSSQTQETLPESSSEDKPAEEKSEEKKDEEEKPKRRFPPSYIVPEDYESATLSPSTPEILGPCVGVRMPHLLGVRNTPVRIYRFLTRRRLMDDIGRQVAAAVLASHHRPYGTVSTTDENSASDAPAQAQEQNAVLDWEEKDWWKTVRQPRKEHEEDIWLQPIAFDELIASRMRAFELTSEDDERANRIAAGIEKPKRTDEDP
ncbi:Mitochondrial import inner membrane translocase subunit tim54 [Pseudocercospora fuligena]|uniref:Mitochondrial import inner membrane translocase subunit TIM54 n=1 Tax=Pseudocercospora fuligena TaxID=685502 RepID=A0A8H6R6N1_9PEZI|nr:Mitochondrial import inner membrane translocase subunit tim54 [Pseudocercospora fuligena]